MFSRFGDLLLEQTEAPVRGELHVPSHHEIQRDVLMKPMECPPHHVEDHVSATKMIQQK